MRYFIFVLYCALSATTLWSQDRQIISGQIQATTNDLEGITIYNLSSNRGTVSSAEGKFKIAVQLNDRLHIESLQFKTITVVIDDKIMTSKQLKVSLVDDVNELNQVVVSPYDLTGNLDTDIENSKVLQQIIFTMPDINNLELPSDYKTGVTNTVLNEQTFVNGVDFIAVGAMLFKALFPKRNKSNRKDAKRYAIPDIIAKNPLTDQYTLDEISRVFEIPKPKVQEFVNHVDTLSQTHALQHDKMRFIEFIFKERNRFLKTTNVTD